MQVLPKYHWPCVPVLDKCRDGNSKETGKWISEISVSVSMRIRSVLHPRGGNWKEIGK